MEGIAPLLAITAMIATWWLIARKLHRQHWLIRHLGGATISFSPADSPVYDLTLTREQALAAVATFFPLEDLQRLVTLQGSGGLTYEAWSPAFQALYYESHSPGLDKFFNEVSKRARQ